MGIRDFFGQKIPSNIPKNISGRQGLQIFPKNSPKKFFRYFIYGCESQSVIYNYNIYYI